MFLNHLVNRVRQAHNGHGSLEQACKDLEGAVTPKGPWPIGETRYGDMKASDTHYIQLSITKTSQFEYEFRFYGADLKKI